ncbi:hypothetical protein CY34DRAFT_9528 [Suillus luteus UH-Slu-Lm8-n1]|uniref:Uncharacterized protein n=1 Tax=Suillus luteus UH-Slu-Lm8-n1 TaxID=930992 RepID=A0A0D0BUE1_9AGAM|nr:hypothetical protein CY34DRAFT_9528 [Suillus luteus UH-Slu-Lm8-n1]
MILKAIMQVDTAAVIAPMRDNVKFHASNAVEAVSAFSTFHPELLHLKFDKAAATSIETLGLELDCAPVTCQEVSFAHGRRGTAFDATFSQTKCNRDFIVPVFVLQGPPCTPGNEAVVATGSGAPGNVNRPLLIERKLSVVSKEESAPVEHPANNSLDSISSAIIPESFEASDSLSLGCVQPFANIQSQRHITTASIESSLSPRKNSIIISDIAFTNVISSVLKPAAEYSIENTGRIHATTPIKTEGTEVPVAVTYADATNLAARYPDLASQILVSPLRKRAARQEIALTAEQDLIEEGPPSKRRPRRPRRHKGKRSRDNQEELQQQSRGSLRTPGLDTSPSRHKDPSSTSGLVDPKATFGFHSACNLRQPDWLVDSAPPTPNLCVERVPSLQTNRHIALATPQERTRNYQGETGDANWGAPTAEIQASTPPPKRLATPKRACVQEQHGAMLLMREERAGAPEATDLATTSMGRRSINADMLLTELFRKAMETSSPSATKFRHPEHIPLRKSQTEGPDRIKTLVTETARPVNQAEKIMEGDSPRVKLPAPSTPPMKTSHNPTYKSPIAPMEGDQIAHQSYKPLGARTQEDHALRQSHMPPAARTEEDYTLRQSHLPIAARMTEDRTITQNYRPPHQRLNENNYNAIITQKPPIYHASSLNRHSSPCAPPSPRAIELLERSERIRHLERLLSRERDLPISNTGLTVPSPKSAQVLQPIGPWQASDEKAFHERGAINPGTSTNQSLDLVRVMQAMGVDISSRKDTLAALGNGKPPGRVDSSSNGVRRQSDAMTMEDTVVRNDLARSVRSHGLRSPRGGGGYRSVSGLYAQWTRYT